MMAEGNMSRDDTIEFIDRRFTGRVRHYAFLRYVLGECPLDAVLMSYALHDEALTLDEMRHVAKGWATEERTYRTLSIDYSFEGDRPSFSDAEDEMTKACIDALARHGLDFECANGGPSDG